MGSTKIIDGTLIPMATTQLDLTVSGSTALTVPTGATVCLIQTIDQNVRWQDDGTAPTATTGQQLESGQSFWYNGDLSAIRIIQESATAKVTVSYYQG